MPSAIQMVPCHYANKSGRGKAACFLPIDTVREMVDAGQAIWNKRATFVNFTKTEAEIHRPAASLKMPEWVLDGFLAGEYRATQIVAGWQPILRAA
jgi:hypothetical protein